MKRVLHYVGRMDIGGMESLLMTMYRNIDRNKIQFDFAVHTTEKCLYDDEIIALGGKFFRFPMMRKNPWQYRKAWDNFWKKHKDEYSAFHFHSPTFANVIAMKSAKSHGVPIVIAHCHNTHAARGKLQFIHDIVHKSHSKHMERYATHFFACSEPAAVWGFGPDYQKVFIMKNGIDLSKFSYDGKVRQQFREKLSLEDKFVVGNVARLAIAKNQSFLLDIFFELKKIKKNAMLMLVGDGPDKDSLTEKAKQLDIESDIVWAGPQKEIVGFLSAMDCFVFPSLHEGLGISLVEAQAMGIPTLTSKNRVPEEVKMSKYLEFLSLDLDAKEWAEKISNIDLPLGGYTHDAVRRAGYNITDIVEKYSEFILSNRNEN